MKNIYFFGDSIGQGAVCGEDGSYHVCADNWTAALPAGAYTVKNYSGFGFTAEKGLQKLRKAADTEPGSLCLIEFGGNDCDLNWKEVAEDPAVYHPAKLEPDRFAGLLETFVSEARERSLRPVLLTPPPLLADRYFAWVTKKNDPEAVLRYLTDAAHMCRQQESYANLIRYTAQNLACPLIDARQTFLRQEKLPLLYCVDGIHLNEKGQKLYGEVLLRALETL